MTGSLSLGQRIGTGRTAEVFRVGDGRVVKLMRPGFDSAALDLEARLTRAAHEAGVAAPVVHGPVEIDGRPGHVFDEAPGRLMFDLIPRRLWSLRRLARLLASTHVAIHARTTAGMPDVKERLAAKIGAAPLGARLRDRALARLASLEDGDRVLHGDFHPGNVFVGPRPPVTIDWLDGARGSPAADVARSLWLISSATVPPRGLAARIARPIVDAFRRPYLKAYLAQTGMDPDRIDRWRLPVVAARMSEGIDHEMAALGAELRRLAAEAP